MEEKIKNITSEIVDKIAELPIGSEFTIGGLFSNYNLDKDEKFEVFKEVLSLCKSNNIQIENTQAGMMLGMPWVFKYKKNN